MMKKLLTDFVKCGLLGWGFEILYTSLGSLQRRDYKLTGKTSLWMFPIYGSACLLAPVSKLLHKKSTAVRGSVYALLIFMGEFISGSLLSKKELCPWNYERSRWHIRKVVRPDYFPFWFLAGLLYEKLLSPKQKIRNTNKESAQADS